MYGKIFESMYEGTLYGHWEAIVTLQQMLVLCNRDGILDMTPQAMAARTSIPLDIITKGLTLLEEPDPYTRTPGEDGKRITRIDAHRPWGWSIVNYVKYRDLKTREEKNQADRVRIAAMRQEARDVAMCSEVSHGVASVANVAHEAVAVTVTVAEAVEAERSKAKARRKSGNGSSPLIPYPNAVPPDTWEAWLEVRKKKRAPNTEHAIALSIAELAKLQVIGQDPIAVVNQSIQRGYTGLFPVHAVGGGAPNQNRQEALEARNKRVVEDVLRKDAERDASRKA